MRLPEFILGNMEPILEAWVDFATGIWPRDDADPGEMRDDVEELLRCIVRDMGAEQLDAELRARAQGNGTIREASDAVDDISIRHAVERAKSGFDLETLMAEYLALRASVIRLWARATTSPHAKDLEDLTAFNQAIDQSLAKAVHTFTAQLAKSRELFLGMLGHDLRSPLNLIAISTHNLQHAAGRGDDDAANEIAKDVNDSVQCMSRMIGDLLDVAHGGLGGRMPLERAPTDLADLCHEVAAEVATSHPDAQLEIQARGNLVGHWDRARLRQVLTNLVNNAVQHGDPQRPIQVEARGDRQGRGEVHFWVHNDGPPIESKTIPRLFEPMDRSGGAVEKRQHRPAGSIGLGLSIVRTVVEAHNGRIEVESSASQGTRFTVYLPRHANR